MHAWYHSFHARIKILWTQINVVSVGSMFKLWYYSALINDEGYLGIFFMTLQAQVKTDQTMSEGTTRLFPIDQIFNAIYNLSGAI